MDISVTGAEFVIGGLPLAVRDSRLPRLSELRSSDLQRALAESVPRSCLDAPAANYRVDNLRYKPGQKIVFSLLSPKRQKPVAVRMFPPGAARQRLEKAHRSRQTPAFLLDEIDAVAWVFPAERKLKLDAVADMQVLERLLRRERGFELQRCTLVHYVPEHSYTARLEGVRINARKATEYLKIYYDDSGEQTAKLGRELSMQVDPRIVVAGDSSYFPEHRMLVQGALARVGTDSLPPAEAAAALAQFHRLNSSQAPLRADNSDAEMLLTRALLARVSARLVSRADAVIRELRARRAESTPRPLVLTHGDAHPGNLLRLSGGRTGFIDLDAVAYGKAEDDLASYFAYLLWLDVREGRSPTALAGKYRGFVNQYNHSALHPVDYTHAKLALAVVLITERVRRAILRGKSNGAADLDCFLRLAAACIDGWRDP